MNRLNGKKIEPIVKYSFYSKMYELIDVMDMKEGEMYFIIKFNYIQEVIFINYQIPKNDKPFAVFSYSDCPTYFAWFLNNSVYRYISEDTKIKEKYYTKWLDIVLRRLFE